MENDQGIGPIELTSREMRGDADDQGTRIENDDGTGEKRGSTPRSRKKRGMKPRSQRSRKWARSELYSNDSLVLETGIRQLDLGGTSCWIRMVKPYPYTFCTHAKARWLGRTVLDVYHSEFGSFPKSYYESAIRQGRILVSDQTVDLNYKIKGGDVLSHTVHRHEPAVAVSSQNGIEILEETKDLVVVDKPATLPVHPCGGYRANSLSHILETNHGKLYNINRLDRLTSGLFLLAKSSQVAQQLGKCLTKRECCQKFYLARVKGKFPLNCQVERNQHVGRNLQLPCRHGEWIVEKRPGASMCSEINTMVEMTNRNALGVWVTDTNGRVDRSVSLEQVFEAQHAIDSLLREEPRRSHDESNTKSVSAADSHRGKIAWFYLACPTRVAKPKDGICEAGSFLDLESAVYKKTVKPSQTAFAVVNYDEETDTTIVMCQPTTGRTHQIRLHLQYLGHPIANDPNYGGEMWYADPQGEDAFARAKTQLDELNDANIELSQVEGAAANGDALPATSADSPATLAELNALAHLKRRNDEPLRAFIQRTCVWCARSRFEKDGSERTVLEFLCRSRGIFLHALAYNFINEDGHRFHYRTRVPPWALPKAAI